MASITKTQQIAKYLREEIQSGHWAPGEKLPGEFDLQAQFGVSRTTVRDALNTLTGEGLVVRKNGNGTYVTENKESSCVAIAADAARLASPLGYWYQLLVEHAHKMITEAGFQAVLVVGHGKTPEEFVASTNILNSLKSTNIVGAIDTTSVPLLSQVFSSKGINNVVIECAIPVGDYCITLDYAAFTRISVEMLNSNGCGNFSVMHYDYDVRIPREVKDPVWREFARLRMLSINNDYDRWISVPGSLDIEGHAYEAFIKWWNSPKRTKSIFFFDDTLFDAASKAIIELGIKVPEDLAILTHANVGKQFLFPVEITKIGFDASEVINAAWGMLDKLIKGEPVYESVVKVQPVIQDGESLGKVRQDTNIRNAGNLISSVNA